MMRMMRRRPILAGAASVVSLSLAQSVVAQSEGEQPEPLTDVEAAFIATRANQRRLTYQGFAAFFDQPSNLQELEETVLPNHEDIITNLFPGSQLASAYDVYSTVDSVLSADEQSRLYRTMEAGPLTVGFDSLKPGAATEAYNENVRLSQAAKTVNETAKSVLNGEATPQELGNALAAEQSRLAKGAEGSETIREWAQLHSDVYGFETGNTSTESAEKIKDAAQQNVQTLELSRKQISRHREAISSRSLDMIHTSVAGTLNNNIDRIPWMIRGEFGSTSINLHIIRSNSENTELFVNTADGAVQTIETGTRTNAEYRMEIPSAELQEIILSENPGGRFRQGLQTDRIKYQGRNLFSSFKSGVIDTVIDFGGGLL